MNEIKNETREQKAGRIEAELSQFTGTEHYYKYMFGLTLTDGTKMLAEKCQAYWLMDIVASYLPNTKGKDFVLVKLKVKDSKAIFTMQEDSGMTAFVTQEIPFTDFPLDEIKLYLINGILILPSEY